MMETSLDEILSKLNITDKKCGIHLGIFIDPYIDYILSGKKTVESRWSKYRIDPYNNIEVNDIVIMKQSSGPVYGYFRVQHTIFSDLNFGKPKQDNIRIIRKHFGAQIAIPQDKEDDFWNNLIDKNCCTLISIGAIFEFRPGINFIRKRDPRGWVKLR